MMQKMKIGMKMPDLATTGGALRIAEWKVGIGQAVKRGQVLLEVETDKALMDVESIATGTLVEMRAQVDEEVMAGQVIAMIEVEKPISTAPVQAAAPPVEAAASAETLLSTPVNEQEAPKRGGMFARNRAAQEDKR